MARARKNGLPTPCPATRPRWPARGWDGIDVLLVTGDAYVDHPAFGAALIGRVLEAEGLRVGIVAQPDWRSPEALAAMGRPRLFCGVTAGNLDSMVANYTAARHRRAEDDYSEGGAAGRRPNHAAVVYAQLARRAFPGLPVVLGGIEASLRRVAHYDYWADRSSRPSSSTPRPTSSSTAWASAPSGRSPGGSSPRRIRGRPPTSPASAAPRGSSAPAPRPRCADAPVRRPATPSSSPPGSSSRPTGRSCSRRPAPTEAEQSPFCGQAAGAVRRRAGRGRRAAGAAARHGGAGRARRAAVHAPPPPALPRRDPRVHDDPRLGDRRARLRRRLQLLRPRAAPGEVPLQPQRGLGAARGGAASPPARGSAARSPTSAARPRTSTAAPTAWTRPAAPAGGRAASSRRSAGTSRSARSRGSSCCGAPRASPG